MSKFLAFNNFHLAPIEGLDDERKLSHNLALNHIAISMGFKAGFGGYTAEWKDKLPNFMRDNGLAYRTTVLPMTLPDQCVQFGYRQIADRLFVSGRPVPKRIFAGLDVFVLLRAAAANGFKVGYGGVSQVFRSMPFEKIKPAEIREKVPPFNYFIRSETDLLWVSRISAYSNLIGDQLCDMGQKSLIVAETYNPGEGDREGIESAGRLLRQVIALCPEGWVEVIPYNDRLAFLKAPDGGYDFVFDGVRDTAFKRNPYAPYLRDKDFSKTEETSELDVRIYFSHDGWLEADRHAAEEAFYAHGGTLRNYPGGDEILQAHLVREGRHAYPNRKGSFRPGYSLATILGKNICFSPLITVRKFRNFVADNADYLAHRSTLPDLEPPNLDSDPDAPAAVTWYDAKAYARWIKRVQKLPVRLLNEDEWLALAAGLIPDNVSEEDLDRAFSRRSYDFIAQDGHAFEGHPPYMDQTEFNALKLRPNQENM